MPMVQKAFDWRGFWADLLKSTGYGLLKLDGGDAAQAAISALDRFDEARAWQRRAGDADDDLAAPWRQLLDRIQIDRASAEQEFLRSKATQDGPASLEYEPDSAEDDDRRSYDRSGNGTARRLRAKGRSRPLSANPYDQLGSPLEMRVPRNFIPLGSRF